MRNTTNVILIAAITSTFAARAASKREQVEAQSDEKDEDHLRERLHDISSRLQQAEKLLVQPTGS